MLAVMSTTPQTPHPNKVSIEESEGDPRRYRYVIMEMDGREIEASDFSYDDPISARAAGDQRALRHRMHRTIGGEL